MQVLYGRKNLLDLWGNLLPSPEDIHAECMGIMVNLSDKRKEFLPKDTGCEKHVLAQKTVSGFLTL
jgi:hypothetical protein